MKPTKIKKKLMIPGHKKKNEWFPIKTQHMVNFCQKSAIFNLSNSRQKKIPPKWLETTLVSQKKTNLNFETTLVSQKKTIF